MEAEIKFLDGLEVKKKLKENLEGWHYVALSKQRIIISEKMQKAYENAREHGYETFNFRVTLSDLNQVHLLPEIEQELKDSHWQVCFKEDTYLIGPSSDEPEETQS